VDAPAAQHLMGLDLLVDDGVAMPAAERRRLRIEVARMARAAARHDRPGDRRADYEVSLRLVDDAAIHVLNRDYRHKNKPTDVLAFAQRESPGGRLHPGILGDIVISVDTAGRQARHGLYHELLHLASHGLCHLLGYDHRDDEEERVMNARAAALRAEAGRRGLIRPA
jgi:probable rRNA maturation factor